MSMRSGDPCESCPIGIYHVYSSKVRGNQRLRYLACDTCGAKAPAERVSADSVRRRRPKKPV